jgi:VWA domain-containing protein
MTLPLADAAALRGAGRRTAAVRVGLGATIAGCLAVAFLLAGGSPPPVAAAAGAGSNVEIVLDLSGSVAEVSNPQILRVLRRAAAMAKRVGLVAFSDEAEEVLPPGTPARELRKMLRYFEPVRGHRYGPTPWSLRFTGGTSISSGIELARSALARDHVHGRLLLVSDAADNVLDHKALRRALVGLARDSISFRLAKLEGATAGDLAVYRRVFGRSAIRPALASRPQPPPPARRSGFPLWLVALAAAAAGLLALRELVAVSLRWRAA